MISSSTLTKEATVGQAVASTPPSDLQRLQISTLHRAYQYSAKLDLSRVAEGHRKDLRSQA
jgi:hypothetical protein